MSMTCQRCTEVPSAEESLAEDVEAEREERRTTLGYVEPRAALQLLRCAGSLWLALWFTTARDPVTAATSARAGGHDDGHDSADSDDG